MSPAKPVVFSPEACSGDMYPGVPTTIPSIVREMFEGLRSR